MRDKLYFSVSQYRCHVFFLYVSSPVFHAIPFYFFPSHDLLSLSSILHFLHITTLFHVIHTFLFSILYFIFFPPSFPFYQIPSLLLPVVILLLFPFYHLSMLKPFIYFSPHTFLIFFFFLSFSVITPSYILFCIRRQSVSKTSSWEETWLGFPHVVAIFRERNVVQNRKNFVKSEMFL